MTNAEENKYVMYKATQAVLEKYLSQVEQLPAFVVSRSNLTGKIAEIEQTDNAFHANFAGKTSSKENAKNLLVEKLVPSADLLFVYGKRINSEEIKSKAKVKPSKLKNMRNNELLNIASVIIALLRTNLAELAPFGVTEAKLTELEEILGAYRQAVADRDVGFASKTASREALTHLFMQTDMLLRDEVDRFVESFKESSPQFYNEYKTARVIWDRAAHRDINEEETTEPAETPSQ